MEAVEINAGEFYLRQLRADDRIDDRVALVAGGLFPDLDAAGAHIAERADRWHAEESCSWAVCDQLTGTAVGEVSLTRAGELDCWITPDLRGRGIATHATAAVLRFGFGFLDLPLITARPPDDAARRVAAKCGFTAGGPLGVWTRLR
ncbi:RimJ/RimL family protein N-acetyltransferase [Saccharothrix saharensis]|uniref:RimJ/RimL family protein N-acetyltransferase n=1 Tax=Saccharothrix saharensis TaxID=571190 RepID=A0A543JIR8_9PSEU|nr:GNAT family N-acetyltransferase [Saccharothrix saharensis]TQM82736.1 RimJ/RimL family protein N-acetyltransferase [Saccharothrix saharensis]